MPIKYDDLNNVGVDPILDGQQTPLVEHLNDKPKSDVISDVMTNIIENKEKLKNTSLINMIGVLTPVTYFHITHDPTGNYATDTNGPNDISVNMNKYTKINNFKIRMSSENNFDNDIDEQEKSYISSGSMIILPRTLKPYENDMFVMKYYNKYLWYRVTSVKVKGFENDSGFECEFTLYDTLENFNIAKEFIIEEVDYIQELVGTTYRPIMASTDYAKLRKIQNLYNHLSGVFNSLFYDKRINCYLLKYHEEVKTYKENITNINTLGKQKGLFRANYNLEFNINLPKPVNMENIYYDSLLNEFIAKNNIFRSYDGLLIAIEPVLPQDRTVYRRSIFGCLETTSVSYYKNTIVSPINITISQPGLPAFFVGKKNIIHSAEKSLYNSGNPDDEVELLPSNLVNRILNGKTLDLTTHCSKSVYGSVDSLIIETIVRYVYKHTDDFLDRFMYLHDHIDDLYETVIAHPNIYYLFPLLGFVIDKSVKTIYQDNVYLR